ncbi:MAG TPA: VapC toxin family PIN domain ribonuclease [Dehalococcoidia bacterium]|nr:VapC toxin family PIN domain ribonuclease [Dehalococcoidia bacterium]
MSQAYPTSYPRRVFVDSSANLALLDATDDNHGAAQAISQRLIGSRSRLFTTNFIIDESYTLIMSHLGTTAAIAYLHDIRASSFTIERISLVDERRAEEILRQYEDKRFSYTDATSFAIIERLRLDAALAFDRNFGQYRIVVLMP